MRGGSAKLPVLVALFSLRYLPSLLTPCFPHDGNKKSPPPHNRRKAAGSGGKHVNAELTGTIGGNGA